MSSSLKLVFLSHLSYDNDDDDDDDDDDDANDDDDDDEDDDGNGSFIAGPCVSCQIPTDHCPLTFDIPPAKLSANEHAAFWRNFCVSLLNHLPPCPFHFQKSQAVLPVNGV